MTKNVLLRAAAAVGALVITTACAGSNPAAPSAALNAPVSAAAAVADARGGSLHGEAQVLTNFDPNTFVVSFDDAVGGRNVTLDGDIKGTNFEPGTCIPGVFDNGLFLSHCVLFGDFAGGFVREAPGGVAFTTCHCTVGGVGNPGDQVTLKISYPPPMPPQYPAGFTKFTFQDGTGALANLSGEGTLDFSTQPISVSFTYRFAPAK